jgi:hypothetical protein
VSTQQRLQQCHRPHSPATRSPTYSGDENTTISQLLPVLRTMTDERQHLLHLITMQQKACRSYLAKVKPRFAVLTVTNLAAGALAAAVAAGPALGGANLLDTVQAQLNVSTEDLLYQLVCAIAFVMSLTSVITANVLRAYDYSARVSAVEGCCAELDSLRIQLLFSAISSARGAEMVAKVAARVPFVAGETGWQNKSSGLPIRA